MSRVPFALILLAVFGCATAPAAPSPAKPPPASAAADAGDASGAGGEASKLAEPDGGAQAADEGEIDDGFDSDDFDAEGPPEAPKAPAITLTDQEIAERLRRDPVSLGSMSVGRANAGALVNGVQMPRGERWQLIDPNSAWGTSETIDELTRSINKVCDQFPGVHPMLIGHISGKHGGYLSPHKSHQSGRDADVSYYYRTASPRWFAFATASNLDIEKTFAFVKAALAGNAIEMMFIDASIQRLLVDYGLKHGEDEAWLDKNFQVRARNPRAIIRHIRGHATHMHLRFYSPLAQELGRRAHIHLAATNTMPALSFVPHKARSGDTLVILARRYGTTVEAIQQANGLRSIALRAGVVYKIPQKAPVKRAPAAAPVRRPLPMKASAGTGRHR